MKLKTEVVSENCAEGFVKVEEFSGVVTQVDIDKLQRLIELLRLFNKSGIKTVEIGIEEDEPIIVFTTKDRSHGYAIASCCGDEEKE